MNTCQIQTTPPSRTNRCTSCGMIDELSVTVAYDPPPVWTTGELDEPLALKFIYCNRFGMG